MANSMGRYAKAKLIGVVTAAGAFPALSAIWFANGDTVSLLFVGLAVMVFVASFLRLVFKSDGAHRYGKVWISEALIARGILRQSTPETLTVSPGDALRLCPQLISEAAQLGWWLPNVQAVLISLGLVGTFVGLSWGLMEAVPCIDPNDLGFAACRDEAVRRTVAAGDEALNLATAAEKEGAAMRLGMSALLRGARLAFSKSIAGVGLGVIYMLALKAVEGHRRADRRAFVLTIVRGWKVETDVDRMADRLERQLSALGTLGQAATQLGDAGGQISRAVQPLESVAGQLRSLSADAIGQQVGAAVERAVKSELSPALQAIQRELGAVQSLVKQVEQHKVAQDEVVTARLKELTEALSNDVLLPMSAEVKAASGQTMRAAEAINKLAPLLVQSNQTVLASTQQTAKLSVDLVDFQKTTLDQLEKHGQDQARVLTASGEAIKGAVDAAVLGLKAQEKAFIDSAKVAQATFEAQRVAVQAAGDQSADAIKRAGDAASKVLSEVQDKLVNGVNEQIEELGRLLRGLKELTANVAVTDQGQLDALRQTAAKTAEQLKALNALARAIQEGADAARAERNGLSATMNQMVEKHGELLRTESAALAQAIESLHHTVNHAEQLQRRAAQTAQSPKRTPAAGGTHG
jgi:hypothetical protein